MGSERKGDRNNYLIIRPENAGIGDIYRFLRAREGVRSTPFLETSLSDGGEEEEMMGKDNRWIIIVSVIVRKIIGFFGKPMEWTGLVVEFFLNLLSQNGDLLGLITNIFTGKLVIPLMDSDTYISTIGHLDGRVDLDKRALQEYFNYEGDDNNHKGSSPEIHMEFESKAMADLCMMAAKLAYENQYVVRNIVTHHWKMHFVDFYNCWNDFQKDKSTQVFILCDKPHDANLIMVSFRGTEPFDADDWSTDFDYSWYEIPNLGKVHMGFLEALGLGNRVKTSTFQYHLQATNLPLNGAHHPTNGKLEDTQYPVEAKYEGNGREGRESGLDEKEGTKEEGDIDFYDGDQPIAYYTVRERLKELLTEHNKAKFVVTGHSLGGALAILFPVVLELHKQEELMERLLGIYTFGQPRVGDWQLGKFMQARLESPVTKYFRVVYCNDLVPRLPYDDKTFLYKHFGVCLYYNSFYEEKSVDEEPNRNYFGIWYLIPEYLNAWWELFHTLTIGYTRGPEYKEGWLSILLRVVGLAFPGISAHSPTNYVNSIRLGRPPI
ncbi:uncharacterized protein LOC18427459 [Amborella trichopoda]|uniref:Fungal lipase-type domain-containing protein n=1 Tax=Amborella trichopoda TaxID=13333 RepID=W1NXL3_AMBTC|nr:uncharacterized protein LOC18427459 [Amborella trichopoda]ERM99424.1 hypothetical protein AMTR_s00131p00074200 [Amborella trichopoda]|eukprot:XP_006836571.1 uncharacterized protein LOC18427459 [Amborella trichopoda]